MASKRKRQETRRNWLDLPFDVTLNILNRIGMVDILENAQLVCTAWHQICKDPTLWRVINFHHFLGLDSKPSAPRLWKQAVDRSQGQLVDLTLSGGLLFEDFLYVANRSSQLRRLEISSFSYYEKLATNVLMKFPLLEELNIYRSCISKKGIKTLGRCCPMLKTLKMNEKRPRYWSGTTANKRRYNATFIAIGKYLPELRHLELIGNDLTNIGLETILDNCHCLETLDLRGCFNLDLKGRLGKRCAKKIKNLKLPNDSLEDYLYVNKRVRKFTADDDDYQYGGDDFEESYDRDYYSID